MSKPLFDASDDSDNGNKFELGTNEEYAKSFNSFRKKELIKKLKDRGYNNSSDNDSSEDTDSSYDDDANLDESFDRDFFKTLSSLKSKDPAIYDKNIHFFSNNSDNNEAEHGSELRTTQISKKGNKPVTLKDYERKVIIEHGGRFKDDAEEQSENETMQRPMSPTVVEEERSLKEEFKHVLEADDSADEEFGGIFKKRIKTKEETTQEETDFAEWLAGKKANIEASAKQKLEPLKNYWNQRNLPQSEKFLRDYILNKGYTNSNFADIPTYEEIVGENDDPQALSEDEHELEKQAEFEEKYNFRFEEPDTEFIKRFPRTIENSVRQDAGKRKEKRQEIKQRKLAEKEQKMKEIEIMKELKRKEIEEKIEKLKKVTGNDELGFKNDELEEDFDPEAHDRRMSEIFNDDFYQVDEGEDKPECPSDIDELKFEDWDNYDPAKSTAYEENYDNNEPHCEDEDFNMDCDYDPVAAKQKFQQELIENTKKRKNRRGRRNRFMEMIQQEKPIFDPEDEKTYGEYIDEYYKIDCEDIIDDIPCRFKYVETVPNDFGLTIEEILLAKNKELNQWASLKKTLQIRPEQVEKRDQRLFKMKAKNEQLKRKIFKSLYGENTDDENDSENEHSNVKQENEIPMDSFQQPAQKKKSKKKRKAQQSSELTPTDTNNKFEAKKPKIDVQNEISSKDSNNEVVAVLSDKKKKKKKKKNKSHDQNPKNSKMSESTSNSTVTIIKLDQANSKITTNNASENKLNSHEKLCNEITRTDTKNESEIKKPKLDAQNEISSKVINGKIAFSSSNINKKNKKKMQNQNLQNNILTSSSNSMVASNKTLENKLKPITSTENAFIKAKENPFKVSRKNDAPKFQNEKSNEMSKYNNKSKTKFNSKSKPKFKAFNKKKTAAGHALSSHKVKINDERLKAYNINPRKFHKKQKFGKNNSK